MELIICEEGMDIMKRPYLTAVVLAAVLTTVGCTVKQADLAVVGSKKLDLGLLEFEKAGENITGESSSFAVLFFPSGHSTIEGAIQNALQKVNGDIMTDAVVFYKLWTIPPLYGKKTIEVTGTVWRQKSRPVTTAQ